MRNIKIIAAVFLLITCVKAASDVQLNADRLPADENSEDEPHVGRSLFHNEGTFCFYPYCWNRRAKCGGGYSCCWCECKNYGAFFSQEKGCYTGEQMKKFLKNEGDVCHFYTEKLKLTTVPLFKDASKVKDIKIGLSPEERSFKLLPNTTCRAGIISYYDYNGDKQRLFNNKCGEKFYMYPDQSGIWNLEWKSTDDEDWKFMAGLLLKMDIHCSINSAQSYSSCILFQVSGQAPVDLTLPEPDASPDYYTCPTIVPVIRTTMVISTTPNNTKDVVGVGDKQKGDETSRGSGNIVSIVAGVLTAVVVLIACIIFLVVLRKRREKKTDNGTTLTLIPSPRPTAQRNRYEDQKALYERPSDCGKDSKYYDDKSCLYVAVDDEPPRYSSIEDEHEYEPPDSRMGTLKRSTYDMSKRPLPKTPAEINNPYYETTGGMTNRLSVDEERNADNSALYSIYSTIDNLRKT